MQTISLAYCEQNRTSGSGESYKALCPACGGHNLQITMHNGFAFCFNCYTPYDIEGVARRRYNKEFIFEQGNIPAIRQLYTSVYDCYREALRPEHYEYFKGRGIDPTTVDAFGIGYCTDSILDTYRNNESINAGLCDYQRHPILSDRIVLPYFAGGEPTDFRGRSIVGEEPKYKGLRKTTTYRGAFYPFNWDNAVERARETKILIVTEGEIKAIAAHQAGFACTALPGMVSWRRGLIPEADWKVVVVFDSDARREHAAHIKKAVRALHKRIKTAYVTVLPLLNEMKMDIDAFLIHPKGGVDEFARFVRNAVPYMEYDKLTRF